MKRVLASDYREFDGVTRQSYEMPREVSDSLDAIGQKLGDIQEARDTLKYWADTLTDVIKQYSPYRSRTSRLLSALDSRDYEDIDNLIMGCRMYSSDVSDEVDSSIDQLVDTLDDIQDSLVNIRDYVKDNDWGY